MASEGEHDASPPPNSHRDRILCPCKNMRPTALIIKHHIQRSPIPAAQTHDLRLPDLLSLTSVPGMRAGHKLASEGPDTRAVQHCLGLGCVKGTHVPTINYRGRS